LKSGVTQYEAMRPMFEAFRVNHSKTTGIIQWMLNSAWPSFYWQLYDYYLVPTTAYYAARKANEPIQLVYNYGDGNVYAVNETYQPKQNLKAKVLIFDVNSKIIADKELSFNLDGVASNKIYAVDKFKGVVFLSLRLFDDRNALVAENFYWLSEKPDELAWNKTAWTHTPMKAHADFRILNKLPVHDLKLSFSREERNDEAIITVTLTNNNQIAFFNSLELVDEKGILIRPVFWDDNYFSLLPGETKDIRCKVPIENLSGNTKILLSGWNIKSQQVELK
jgi:exo-1,4-beta-D-glucosaminidase